ncbi:unnamed protein product [Trichogramma brassicae]|uniref:Uncharacterized protein n=1 Tax=Trichogramma brassicae TaxID=86971 RepID=A0A6H5I7U5_9HYME|nr:unnamed protein product [Trichogramma brassicae]
MNEMPIWAPLLIKASFRRAQNQEKFYLYVIVSVTAGVLILLSLVIGRLLFSRHRAKRDAKFHANNETLPNGFTDDISEIDADIDLTTPVPVAGDSIGRAPPRRALLRRRHNEITPVVGELDALGPQHDTVEQSAPASSSAADQRDDHTRRHEGRSRQSHGWHGQSPHDPEDRHRPKRPRRWPQNQLLLRLTRGRGSRIPYARNCPPPFVVRYESNASQSCGREVIQLDTKSKEQLPDDDSDEDEDIELIEDPSDFNLEDYDNEEDEEIEKVMDTNELERLARLPRHYRCFCLDSSNRKVYNTTRSSRDTWLSLPRPIGTQSSICLARSVYIQLFTRETLANVHWAIRRHDSSSVTTCFFLDVVCFDESSCSFCPWHGYCLVACSISGKRVEEQVLQISGRLNYNQARNCNRPWPHGPMKHTSHGATHRRGSFQRENKDRIHILTQMRRKRKSRSPTVAAQGVILYAFVRIARATNREREKSDITRRRFRLTYGPGRTAAPVDRYVCARRARGLFRSFGRRRRHTSHARKAMLVVVVVPSSSSATTANTQF